MATSVQEKIDALVAEATARSAETAALMFGRAPTASEVAVVLLQCQISMLSSYALADEDLVRFWTDVVEVARQGRGGEAS
jgi:hypothetical protein